MRLDSHHFFSERYPLAHLETILKRNRFDGSILVANACVSMPDFVKGVVLRSERFDSKFLDGLQGEEKFRGVCYPLTGSAIPDFFGDLERRGLTLDVEGGLAEVPRIAERFPHLRIAIDHLGAPFAGGWEQELADAAAHPNVFCKASGLTCMTPSPVPYVRHALAVFGPGRVMFGSDWPNSLPEHSWKASLAAFTQAIGPQPIEIREELLGGTAARFYAL